MAGATGTEVEAEAEQLALQVIVLVSQHLLSQVVLDLRAFAKGAGVLRHDGSITALRIIAFARQPLCSIFPPVRISGL
jgi:hypothetical protein